MSGAPVATEIKDKDGNPVPDEITMDNLQQVIKTAIADMELPQIKELRDEMGTIARKAVFPDDDGHGESQAGTESVVDTRMFSKSYQQRPGDMHSAVNLSNATGYPVNVMASGLALGQQLCNFGGPFKRLSPEMETFAKMLKVRGKPAAMLSSGIDVQECNHKVFEGYEHAGVATPFSKQAGMNEGVLADGGALVPVEFFATVIEFATMQSEILSKVWRIPMTTNLLRIPRLVQAAGTYFGGITLYSPGEGELKESTKPELERLTFEAKKLIGLIYLTDELIADSMINVVNYVTGLFTRAFQYDVERRVIQGLGTAAGGPCLGIINDPAINIVARQTAGTIGYLDVVNLDNALDENFVNLDWITRKVTQNTLMALRDNQNRPIFLADYAVFTGQSIHPNTMISYPVHRTRNVPAMGTQGDLILGDLSWYLLAMRQDLTIASSSEVRFIYDEETIRFVMRFDGMPAVSIAFAILGDVAS